MPAGEGFVEFVDGGGVAAGAGQGVEEVVDVHVAAGQPQGVARALGDDQMGRGAGRPGGFQGAAECGDEGAQGADGAGGRVGPQVVDEGVGGDGASFGGDQPGEYFAVARSAEVDGGAVGVQGADRAEHFDAHSVVGGGVVVAGGVGAHVPILLGGGGCGRTALIAC